jgi:hypothetical protein
MQCMYSGKMPVAQASSGLGVRGPAFWPNQHLRTHTQYPYSCHTTTVPPCALPHTHPLPCPPNIPLPPPTHPPTHPPTCMSAFTIPHSFLLSSSSSAISRRLALIRRLARRPGPTSSAPRPGAGGPMGVCCGLARPPLVGTGGRPGAATGSPQGRAGQGRASSGQETNATGMPRPSVTGSCLMQQTIYTAQNV